MKRPNDANKYYLNAIRLNPKCAIAWSNLGGAFNDNSDYEQAIKCYNHALAIIPDFADAHSNKGNALFNMGCEAKDHTFIDKAKICYVRAHELRPDFTLAEGNLARIYIYYDDRIQAMKLLQNASLQDPAYYDALNNLSALYFEMGRMEDCIKVSLRVLKLKSNHYCAYHNLANALKMKVR
jgi:protein O-GlcNAc transferase